MTSANTDLIQAVMTRAYDRWDRVPGTNMQAFWDDLDADERIAVFAGNLNYQVCNGGFAQYLGNGYATPETIGFVRRLCARMPSNHPVNEVAAVLAEFEELLDRLGWKEPDLDEGLDEFDSLDGRFYAVNDAWLDCVGRYLGRRGAGRLS